jgi:hypothetical protein
MGQCSHGKTRMHYPDALLFICHDSESGFSGDPLRFGHALSPGNIDALLEYQVVYLSHAILSERYVADHVVHSAQNQDRSLVPPVIRSAI